MTKPLVVSIPHSLGRDEAMRRLKTGLSRAASSVPVLSVDEERWEDNRMIFRVRALGQAAAGHVDVAEDHVRVEVVLPWLLAALCRGGPGRDPEPRQAVADQEKLTFPYTRLRFRAGFTAPLNLAFSTATGRCASRSDRRNCVASASAKPSTV